jgi:hypothetical protein
MEQLEPVGQINSVLHRDINPTPILVIVALFCLFIFPGFLFFLVPIMVMTYVNKFSIIVSGAARAQPARRKDPRRLLLTLIILAAGLIFLFVMGVGAGGFSGFGEIVLIYGICTGGFVWAPLGSYAIARIILFAHDKVTGHIIQDDIAQSPPIAAPAPIPTPDLSLLSPSEQSLVVYLADASARNVTHDEIALILKGNGWLDADITHGFELARTYYPGVLK